MKRFAVLFAVVAVLGSAVALATNRHLTSEIWRYVQTVQLEQGLTNINPGATLDISSTTSATTATTSVAAVTIRPTAYLGTNDLVLNVKQADGGSLFKVDNEGDVTAAGAFAPSSASMATLTVTGRGELGPTGFDGGINGSSADFSATVTAGSLTVGSSFNRGQMTTADAGTGVGTATATVVGTYCACSPDSDVTAIVACSVTTGTLTGLAPAEGVDIDYVCL